jgi:hypothetical protein
MKLKYNRLSVESETPFEADSIVGKQHSCSKCDRTFDKLKMIQDYVCPHCMTKIEEEGKMGCQYWFGYLNQKDKSEPMPKECVECEKVVECMLNQYYNSAAAVAEVKKWY